MMGQRQPQLTAHWQANAEAHETSPYVAMRLQQLWQVLGFWDPELTVALADLDIDPVMFAQPWIATL